MVDLADSVFRDYVTDGVPSSGGNKPKKSEIRALLAYYESLVTLAFTNGKVYATKAALDADLGPGANTPALVIGDSANDGIYMKVGATATGSWTQLTDFVPGTQIVHAVDAGAGTANAIVATSALGLSSSGSQIIRLDIFEPNTATPVTIAFNGGSVLTVKTASGNNPAVGGLTVGPVLGFISGSTFRLLSDQASAAVLAGAESAQGLAEVAQGLSEDARDLAQQYASDASTVSGVNVPIYASVASASGATIVAGVKSIRTQFRTPIYTTPATLVGGANYARMSLAAITAAGYPALAYFRSTDRYMPDGTTDATNGGYWLLNERVLDATMFGTDGTAIQAGVNYLTARGKGGEITISDGDWLVTGQASGDSQLTGIVVPYSTQIDPEKRIAIRFSRGAVLKANSNNMIVLRVSDSLIDIHEPIIDGNGHTGVWGIAVVPEDMDQTATRVDQSYVNIFNPFISECAEGVVYQAGPRVTGTDSACFYNWVHGGHIFNCTRGVWRKAGPNASAATVNAGGTIGLRIGGICNTGIDNEAASGNSDIATGLESINDGTSPHATPTAYRVIQTASTGADNNDNILSQPRFESNTRDIDNANATTMIVDAKNLSGTKCLFTALPRAVSSGSAVLAPQIGMAGGLQYQSNAYVAGLPVAVLRVLGRGIEIDSTDVFKIYDKGFEWADFALTVANVTNADSIGTMLSKFQRTGGFVEWHFRFRFDATTNNVDVVINLPRAAETALYTTTAGILAMHVPLFLHDGVSDVARWGVLGATTLTVSPGGTWNAAASTNEIHGCIRYREQGV